MKEAEEETTVPCFTYPARELPAKAPSLELLHCAATDESGQIHTRQ